MHEVIETLLLETILRTPIDTGSFDTNKLAVSIIKGDIFTTVADVMETDTDSIAMFAEDSDEEHLLAYC